MAAEKTLRERFLSVVQATETNVLSYLQDQDSTIQRLHFQFGHPKMVIEELKKLQQPQANQYKKYPLIAVFEDVPERPVASNVATISPRIVIAWQTKQEYTREQRDELSFKPILLPIYDEFMTQLKSSAYFVTNYQQPGERVMRPFWGREGLYGNEGNIFNDYLDCIEIRNIELQIRQRSGCAPAGFHKSF